MRCSWEPTGSVTALALSCMAGVALVTSCEDSRQESTGFAAERASLTEGRRFDVLIPSSSSGMERLEVRIGDDSDGHYADLTERLSAACNDAVGARANSITTTMADGRALGATADLAAHSLCMGHEWMNLATAPNITDFYDDGSFTARPQLDEEETRTEQLERLIGTRGLDISLPVPSNRSAATFAYLAVDSFREAALTGAEILELAPTNSLDATVRAAAEDGSGLSDDPTDTTPLADAIVFLTAEATQRMIEAARMAGGLSSNQAQARLAERGGDRADNTMASWVSAHDSRYETAGMWMGWPDCSCCEVSLSTCPDPEMCSLAWCAHADDYAGPTIDDCACCANDPETCPKPEICDPGAFCGPGGGGGVCTPTANAEDDTAIEIIASLGVLPPIQTTEQAVLDELADAVRADDPNAPPDLDARDLLESRYGISAASFLRGWRHTHERIGALGLPLARRADDGSGLSRYSGMRAIPTPEQLAAYTSARTIGPNRFDYQAALTAEGAYRGSTTHIVPFAYGRQGVLPALDVIGTALRHALARPELAPTEVVPGRPEPDGARRMAHAALSLARSMVAQRIKLRVGRRNTDGFDRMELTCYGCTGRSSTYALVVGEAGLHCATTHAIAGEPCDLEDYRVNVTPTVLSESVHSGIAGQHLVFTINASHLPPGVAVGGRIPSVHFYLTELVGASRRVLTTFAPVEGPNAGTYSRTTYIPVVAQGMQVATAQAVPSTEECDEPRECCDGLPCDPMLPRESELVTDRLGENRYESIDEALYRTALDAATYADALGVEAIQQQLVADQAAHGARDELEALCGGAINVEMLGPAQCNTDEDCGGSPGSCVPSDHLCTLASAISMQEGPDTSSIEACIGNFLVHVNFGSTGLCYFQAIDPLGDPQTFIPLRTPCVCLDSDATCEDTLFELGCPREPDDGGCSDAYPALGANYLVGATTALNETESAGGDDSPRCDLLPVLRSGSTEGVRMEAAEELLQQEWLRELTFSELGERVGFKPDLLQTGRATIDGAGWYATGSVHFGPTPEGFPCDAHAIATDYGTGDPIDECEPGAGSDFTFGRPLLCGVGSCGSVANRIEMNYRLYDAATLIAILGRASGRYLYRPGYKGYNDDVGFEVSADRWTPSVDDPDYYDEPFSGWEAQSFGPLPGMVAVVGDRALFRACASEEVCATTDLPSYYGLVPLPNDVLPDWHGVENGSGDLFVGQIIRALDDANHGDDSTGLGGDQPALQNGPLGDLLDPWIWLPLFHPGTAPEFQYEVQCVRIDNPSGGLGEAAYAFGAVCPTLFAPVPADLASLTERTSTQSISDFWDHTPGEGATYTVHDLVYDVARRTRGDGGPSIGQWSVALAGLKELGRQLGNAEDENEVPNPQETPYGRVLDALELACLAAYEEGAGSCGTDVSQTPQIEGPDDFPELERALDCAASSIERGIENAVLFDVPHEILQDVQSDQISTTYPELQGEYGEATASLRSSVETVTLATNQIASAARQLSTDIGIARQQLIVADLEEDLAVAQAQAQQAANVGSCINSAGEAAEALNSGAQIIPLIIGLVTGCIADALAAKAAFDAEDIAEDLNNAQSEIILLELQAQFGHQMDSIASAGTLMIQGYAQMQQALTQLDTIRNQAASAAMVVLGYTLDPLSGRENNYLQAQRRWTSLWRARYEHAFANARRNAWYARHALEARIGMDLSEMNNQLALVEPPALWADRLCTMTALNYDELRVVGDEVEQSDPYDNGFLSDYVRRLGLVKDSYPLDFDYQDERDTAVISVRDEIFNEVLQCDVTGHNQLFEAADPSVVHAGGIGGWFPAFEANGYGIDSSPIPGSPFEQYLLDENTLVSKALGGATAQLMSSTDPVDELDPLARRPSWAQTLSLPPGRWALSWSEELPESDGLTCAGMTSPTETQLEPELISQNAVVVQLEAEYLTSTEDTQSHPCWRRVRMIFQNPVAQDVMIGFAIRETPSAVNPLPSVRWAAPQLESVALTAMPSTILPTSFFPTDDDLAAFIGLCEDTNGDRLRTHFTYQCEPICPPEFGDHCSGGQYCYWESNFVIDIEALMNGENAQFGGIAARSYNHRLQSLALNLVGTNVRDCERSSLPSVCYASGFLPYSLRLERGSIRNHFGEPVFPPYSPADVEFARALATERYVSNPISSADQSLLAGFWRRSFQGYPLSAHYRLRIVDVDELAWERVRDIQLVVEYSAWRNQN